MMNEILKKLPELDRRSIENVLEMIRERKDMSYKEVRERLKWRVYGIADILLNHGIINADEYCVLADSEKWGVEL